MKLYIGTTTVHMFRREYNNIDIDVMLFASSVLLFLMLVAYIIRYYTYT